MTTPLPADAAKAVRTLDAFVNAHANSTTRSVHFAWFLPRSICGGGKASGRVFTDDPRCVTCARCAARLVRLRKEGRLEEERKAHAKWFIEELKQIANKVGGKLDAFGD